MAQLSTPEYELVDGLLECIAAAMARVDDVEPEYATKTKLQKLVYLAVDEFDLSLTYSWYLAGAVVPGDPATPAGLESAFDDVPRPDEPAQADIETALDADVEAAPESGGPFDKSCDSDDASDTSPESDTDPIDPVLFSGDASADSDADSSVDSSTDSDSSPISTPPTDATPLEGSRDQIIDFYTSTIREVWHQNTMRFLQNFYLEYAPPAYRDLYVQSTHLRTRLREVETTIEARLKSEQPSRSIDEIATAASLDISDLHCTIRASESLAPTFDGFVRGTDLIEDALMMLADREPGSLSAEHLTVARSMQDFFYYYVWRYPCLVISQETATGPSADLLRARHRNQLTDFETELERAADRFERGLAAAGLQPDYTDYEESNDDVAATIDSLAEQYLE